MEAAQAVAALVGRLRHPALGAVTPMGSRARGEEVELSDWYFAVAAEDFDAARAALPALVGAARPIAALWDPLSTVPIYFVILAGPLKVDLFLTGHAQRPAPPWRPAPETLQAIDDHFWDWSLWLAAKAQAGRTDLVAEQLGLMFCHLLGPMGVEGRPRGIGDAVRAYAAAREAQEARLGVRVRRELEREVRPVVERAG